MYMKNTKGRGLTATGTASPLSVTRIDGFIRLGRNGIFLAEILIIKESERRPLDDIVKFY